MDETTLDLEEFANNVYSDFRINKNVKEDYGKSIADKDIYLVDNLDEYIRYIVRTSKAILLAFDVQIQVVDNKYIYTYMVYKLSNTKIGDTIDENIKYYATYVSQGYLDIEKMLNTTMIRTIAHDMMLYEATSKKLVNVQLTDKTILEMTDNLVKYGLEYINLQTCNLQVEGLGRLEPIHRMTQVIRVQNNETGYFKNPITITDNEVIDIYLIDGYTQETENVYYRLLVTKSGVDKYLIIQEISKYHNNLVIFGKLDAMQYETITKQDIETLCSTLMEYVENNREQGY